jgi:hypothetical protein
MTRTAQNTDGPGVRRWGRISEMQPTGQPASDRRPRGVRFHPGALRRDVMSPLYDLSRRGTGAREERMRSGVYVGDQP